MPDTPALPMLSVDPTMPLAEQARWAGLTPDESRLASVLHVFGLHFGGLTPRGRGCTLHFWRGAMPPEAVTLPRRGLRSFAVRLVRKGGAL